MQENIFLKFFDKLEDHVRIALSKRPILYGLLGGIGMVLFWRGVWLIADVLYISGPASFVLGVVILLALGLFVSVFIGDQIIISGIKQEKKVADKTAEEIRTELELFLELRHKLEKINQRIEHIEKQNKA